MKTTVITPGTYALHAAELEIYHRFRHDVFCSLKGLGRQDLYAAAGHETDIWDLPHFNPVHFLVVDGGRAVAAGRMTSAARPTMMEILYAEFLDGPVERDANLWEMQRVAVDQSLGSIDRERAFLTLVTEMTGYALRNAGRQMMMLTFEAIWKKRLEHMRPMGPVGNHLGFPHIALINELSAESHAARCAHLQQLNHKQTEGKAA